MKKRAEKEGGEKKEMITVEVKNGSASRATASLSANEIRQKATASVIG
jgi:type IV pilus biogenesis protein CpaD/CtpE